MLNKVSDTIVAIATGKKESSIGVIRLSGALSYEIGTKIIKKDVCSRKVVYSKFFDKDGFVLDFGLVLFFKLPKSYTGEDVFEFHVHANKLILDYLVFRSIELGARLAEAGEFTFRAFFNGKMDLLQAESVNQLINARSLYSVRNILKTLDGEFSKEIISLSDILLDLRKDIEASIDFPEFVDFDVKSFYEKFLFLEKKFYILMNSISSNNFSFDIIKSVIIGAPNVGKSSLFNLIIGKERSIVSNISGTTRDYIDSEININNMIFRFVDTAGINNNSCNFLEKVGMKRSVEQLSSSSIVIYVIDLKDKYNFDVSSFVSNMFNKYSNIKKIFIINNKIDLFGIKSKIIEHKNYTEVYMSAINKDGFDLFINSFKKFVSNFCSDSYIVCDRNYNLLIKFKNSIIETKALFDNNCQIDLLAENIRFMHSCLANILGRDFSEEIITEIFSNFCLGK